MTATATAECQTLALAPKEEALPATAAPPVAGHVALTSPASLMMTLLAQGGDLDQFERMMELQERFYRHEAEKAFNDAMTAFRALNITIPKRKKVDFENRTGGRTQYKHAELSDVTELLGPALSANGFSWSWKTRQDAGGITVTCVLRHRQGHAEEVSLTCPPDASGGKNSIQAVVSTTTYLQRHTLKAVTGTAEADDDDDGQGAPREGAEARAEPTVLEHWCQKVRATKTRADLTKVMKEGVPVFRSAQDRRGYNEFSRVIQQHGLTLPPERSQHQGGTPA